MALLSLGLASPAQAGPGAAEPVADEGGTMTAVITGMRNSKGKVVVAVWDQASGFPMKSNKAIRIHYGSVSGGKATVRLAGYPPGKYALSVFHDENSNGELDTNFLGIPKEGVGASRNPKPRMGPPKFKDAVFTLGAEDEKLPIRVTYI